MKKRAIALLFVVGVLFLAGCGGNAAIGSDQRASTTQLSRYEANQPIPQSDFSQYRQTLLDVEQAQIHGVATTTFFYNMGSNVPVKSCPSLGYPVASTSQLTNPEQITRATTNSSYEVIPQLEPNGTYTGDSSGTYVACVSPTGQPYVSYWEGSVETEGGAAHYDSASSQIVLDGAPTVTTKSGK